MLHQTPGNVAQQLHVVIRWEMCQSLNTGASRSLSHHHCSVATAGQASVLWPSLLWGLLGAPDAHKAYEQTLGTTLLCADLSEELEHIFSSQHSEQHSAESAGSVPGLKGVARSWMDQTLDYGLADAQQDLADGKRVDALKKAAGCISVAAAAGYQPKSVWLHATWQCITQAAEGMMRGSSFDELLSAHIPAVIIAAAYSTIVQLGVTDSDLLRIARSVIWERSVQQIPSPSDLWLQAIVVAAADPGPSSEGSSNCLQRLTGNLNLDWCYRLEAFQPQAEILVQALAVMLQYKQLFGLQASAPGKPSTPAAHLHGIICTILCRTLQRNLQTLAAPELCKLVGLAAAFHEGCSSDQQLQWVQVIKGSMERLLNMAPAAISTVQLLNLYTAILGMPDSGHLASETNQLVAFMIGRIQHRQHALSSPELAKAFRLIAEAANPTAPQKPGTQAAAGCTVSGPGSSKPDTYGLGILSALALANDKLSVLSAQQVVEVLKALAVQAIRSDNVGNLCHLVPGLLPSLIEAVTTPASSTAAPATEPVSRWDQHAAASAAGYIASLLCSTQQLPVFFTVETMDRLVLLIPQMLPHLKPEQAADLMWFVAKQQLQEGRCSGGLALSREATELLLQSSTSIDQSTAAATPANTAKTALADFHMKTDDMLHAYCPSSGVDTDSKAAAVAAKLMLEQDAKVSGFTLCAQQLVDMAQALGASKLPVEAAVMDVLAYHVGRYIDDVKPDQLPVLLWAFAVKHPNVSHSRRVVYRLAYQAIAWQESYKRLGKEKEAAVVDWAIHELAVAGFT